MLVGIPMIRLLLGRDVSCISCVHSQTMNPQEIIAQGDIVIVAIGKPYHIPGYWLKENAVVIDVGINNIPSNMTTPLNDQNETNTKKKNVIVGDVHFEEAIQRCSYITPVPGGTYFLFHYVWIDCYWLFTDSFLFLQSL
jgi:methylenetetrahydrofolate dehydrogenase (NADP+) / methenyltetrahydrofolate cyclohydrolase